MSVDTRFDFIKNILGIVNDQRYNLFINQLYYQARNNTIKSNKKKIESDDITPVNISKNIIFKELSKNNNTFKKELNFFKNDVLNKWDISKVNLDELKKLSTLSNNDLSLNTFAIALINKIMKVIDGNTELSKDNWNQASKVEDKNTFKKLLEASFFLFGKTDTNGNPFSINLDKLTLQRLLHKISKDGYSQAFFAVDKGSYDFINTLELGKYSNSIDENLLDNNKINLEFQKLNVNNDCYSIGIKVNTDDLKGKCQSFMEQCLLGEDESKCKDFLFDDIFQKGLKEIEIQMKANPMIALKLLKSLKFQGNVYPDGYKQVESFDDWVSHLESRMSSDQANKIKNNQKITAYLKILINIVNTSEITNIIEGRIPSRMTGYNFKNKVQIINPFYQPLFLSRLQSAIGVYNTANNNLWATNVKQKYYLGPILGLKRYQLFQNKPLFLYRPFINYYNSMVIRFNRFNNKLPVNYHNELIKKFNQLKQLEAQLYRVLYYNDSYGNLYEMFPQNKLISIDTYNKIKQTRISYLNKVQIMQSYILNEIRNITNLMNTYNRKIVKIVL